MNGFTEHLGISLRLHFRNKMALLYGYLFPLIFLAAFWVLYRYDKVPLLRHMGEPLALAHHRRRQSETRPAQHAHREQFAHVLDERGLLISIENQERHEEDDREQIAVEQRHLVPRIKSEGDLEVMKQAVHSRSREPVRRP